MDNNKKEAGECTEENGNSSVDREESSIRSISVSGNKNFVVNNCNFNYINIPEIKQPEKRAPVRKEDEVPSKKKKGASTSQDSAVERKKPCLHDESVDEIDLQSTSQDSAVERKKPCLHNESVDEKDHQSTSQDSAVKRKKPCLHNESVDEKDLQSTSQDSAVEKKKPCVHDESVDQIDLQGHEEKVTEEELQVIAPRIADNRKIVAQRLGLKAHEIANIDAYCYGPGNGGTPEAAFQMLLKWQRSNGLQATKRILGNALRAAGFREDAENLERNIR
ncbi:uncharacterized protein [Apostichopus japonicus]|uniref:uncharacterized protein isoform X2 n=1 Tax=Stichopus japonicus TaxID=307972 RepID=UPI003AB57303